MNKVKESIEAYFKDNWVETPIQYEGTDFIAPSRWISLAFVPIDRVLTGYDGSRGRKKDIILLKIASFDTSTTLALKLEQQVRDFIECYQDDVINYNVGILVPNGNGCVPLENDVYQTISNADIIYFN